MTSVSLRGAIGGDAAATAETVLTVTPAEGVPYEPLKPGDFITAWDREYLILSAEPGLFEREWKYRLEPAGDFCDPCARRDHTACEGGDGLRTTGCGCYARRLDDAHDWDRRVQRRRAVAASPRAPWNVRGGR